jgi:uncharacterized protein YciI
MSEQTRHHHLLLYTYVPDMAQRRGPYREAHLANIQAEKDAGRILLAGATGNPVDGGALAWEGVSAEHVEAFVAADPYMAAGLIVGYRIEPWTLV